MKRTWLTRAYALRRARELSRVYGAGVSIYVTTDHGYLYGQLCRVDTWAALPVVIASYIGGVRQ